MDRQYPGFPTDVRWCYYWFHLRRWICSLPHARRILPRRFRTNDALACNRVLPGRPRPGNLHWYWLWMPVRPRCCHPLDLF